MIFIADLAVTAPAKYTPPLSVSFVVDGQCVAAIRCQSSKFFRESKIERTDRVAAEVALVGSGVRWEDGIAAFDRYLTPIRLHERAKFSGDFFPFSIEEREFIPLYAVAFCAMAERLMTYMEMALYGLAPNQLVDLFKALTKVGDTLRFPELSNTIIMLLSREKPMDEYMGFIEFLPVVKTMIDNNDFVICWLISVYNEFSKNQSFLNDIHQIVRKINVGSDISVFVVWLYSYFFRDVSCEKVFLSIINSFDFQININYNDFQIYWIFMHKSSGELSQIMIDNGINYLKKNKNTENQKCFDVFYSLVGFDSFNIDKLNLEQVSILIPFAADSQNTKSYSEDLLINLINKFKSFGNDSEIINTNKDNFLAMSWKQITKVIEFEENILFYCKWVNINQPNSYKILEKFLDMITKCKLNLKIQYLLLLIFNNYISNYLDDSTLKFINQLKSLISNFDFVELLNYISTKKNEKLFNNQTLNFIHQKTKKNQKEQEQFINMLLKGSYKDFDAHLLIPISINTYLNCIKIVVSSNIKNKILENELLKITRQILWELKPLEIKLISSVIPFNSVFNTDSTIVLANEDKALFYASLSPDYNPDFINYSQISFRLASLLSEPILFQFPLEDDSMLNQIRKDITFNLEKWKLFHKPRFQYHSIRKVTIYFLCSKNLTYFSQIKKCFSFINIDEIFPVFIDDSITNIPDPNGHIVIIKPINTSTYDPTLLNILLSKIISSKTANIAINANALKDILSYFPEFLQNIFSFEKDNLNKIEWEPHNDHLFPKNENLPIIELQNNTDTYFNSIPFSIQESEQLISKICMKNQRVFAAKLQNDISIFNFDFSSENENSFLRCALQKEMAMCLLSLMTNLCDIDRM